jgi:hypothetical protein
VEIPSAASWKITAAAKEFQMKRFLGENSRGKETYTTTPRSKSLYL